MHSDIIVVRTENMTPETLPSAEYVASLLPDELKGGYVRQNVLDSVWLKHCTDTIEAAFRDGFEEHSCVFGNKIMLDTLYDFATRHMMKKLEDIRKSASRALRNNNRSAYREFKQSLEYIRRVVLHPEGIGETFIYNYDTDEIHSLSEFTENIYEIYGEDDLTLYIIGLYDYHV